jgi:putative membrane protein
LTSQVDIFKKIVFRIPDYRKTLTAILGLSLLYSSLFIVSASLFTPLSLGIGSLFLLSAFAYSLPAVLSGELLYRFLPDYPRSWGYFLAFSMESVLFVYSLILTGADNFGNAWSIFWLALATVYIANFFILLLTIGYEYIGRIAALSAVQPLALLAAFHYFLGSLLGMGLVQYLLNLRYLAIGGIVMLLCIALTEYLISVNSENVSALNLTAGLLQKNQEQLEIGYETCPEVQTLEIENDSGHINFAAPWIHPGPLEGFGGGRIASEVIEGLEEDGEGFFFHVPSTHKADPAEPESSDKVLEAVEKPEKTSEASKLVRKDYENVKFYGRKFDGQKLVFMDADWDDFEMPVFKEMIDLENVILVDMHCHDREIEEREDVWYGTEEARELREALTDFLGQLEDAEPGEYSAGFTTDTDGKPVMSLIEEVGDQKTLTIGIEGNGTSEKVRDLRERLKDDYDEVLVFSTDTHRSIHDLSSKKQVEIDRIEEAVEQAASSISKASIGISQSEAGPMNLLQEDYHGLIFSINILTRLLLLALLVMYIWLVYWVFF